MSYGLKVWNSSGTVTLDTTDRVFRFFSSYTVPNATFTEAIGFYSDVYVPGASADGTWLGYMDNSPGSVVFSTNNARVIIPFIIGSPYPWDSASAGNLLHVFRA